jgi:Arc/MetJ-type ribon-helix-helix transcriptional regulator
MTERITISVPDEMAAEIHDQLDYGDNRSEWIRDAIEEKLDRDQQRSEPGQQVNVTGGVDAVESVDLPASVDRADAAAAVDAVVAHLRERGPTTMRQLVTTVGQEHPLGYDIPEEIERGERYRGAWSRRVVKPALQELPAVEAPPTGKSEWQVAGYESG